MECDYDPGIFHNSESININIIKNKIQTSKFQSGADFFTHSMPSENHFTTLCMVLHRPVNKPEYNPPTQCLPKTILNFYV